VDLASAHATATPFNDAAEARALVAALGPETADVAVHPFKAQVGHTLGAAGALELLVCLDAIARGVLPAAAGEGPLDPDARVRLLDRGESARVDRALKLASAFGGANAALVVSRAAGLRRPRRSAFLHGGVRVSTERSIADLAAVTGLSVERLERTDRLVRLALSSVAALVGQCGSLAGAGVVVGTALGPIETNAVFAARLRAAGARAAEPRRFPYTSPNAVAGECSIAFGLTGPSFAVGGGMHAGLEAMGSGAILVEAGDVDRMVVVVVDDAGPATRNLAGDAVTSGAVAFLVAAQAGPTARGRIASVSLRRGGAPRDIASPGHAALLGLLEPSLPSEIVAVSPPDVTARIAFEV
jgi:3-oxoacyl-[acyl-carrier-protein] synthase-1/3-oxoacyl-[acyl-carrier-protein] synthase II